MRSKILADYSAIEEKFTHQLQSLLKEAREEPGRWLRNQRVWVESFKSLLQVETNEDLCAESPDSLP